MITEKKLRICFLGTGGADWPYIPSDELKADFGKKIRRTCSLLINGRILIDPAPSSYHFAKNVLGFWTRDITDVFLTHSHNDHFDAEVLRSFAKDVPSKRKLRFHCHENTLERLGLDDELKGLLELHPVHQGEEYALPEQMIMEHAPGERTIKFMPLTANHAVERDGFDDETVLHYLFTIEGKKLFYGCDGGWFTALTWKKLMNQKIDLVILEATVGEQKGNFRVGGHNSLPMVRLLREAMYENEVIDEKGKIILTHFSRELHEGIEETERKLAIEGLICAYDGLSIGA